MTVHTEWASASNLGIQFLAPGEYEDAYGSKNDLPALAMGSDSSFIIEGTIQELRRALTGALDLLDEKSAGMDGFYCGECTEYHDRNLHEETT